MLGARCMVQLLSAENFWQCGSSALQKKPFAARYLPFATIHSPFASRQFTIRCRFGLAEASPSRS